MLVGFFYRSLLLFAAGLSGVVAAVPEVLPQPPASLARAEGVQSLCACSTGLAWIDVWSGESQGADELEGRNQSRVRIPLGSLAAASRWIQWELPTAKIHWLCSGMTEPETTSVSEGQRWWSVEIRGDDADSGAYYGGLAVTSFRCSSRTGKLRIASWASVDYPTSVPFTGWEAGYACVKVPSLVSTRKGTLIAFGEGRWKSCSDFAETDIIAKRSTDNGLTWSSLQVVRSGSEASSGTQPTVVGNSAPVQLPSGRLLLPHTRDNRDMWLMHSDDDGLTWSPPRLLPNVTQPDWQWIGTGPPASLRLSTGRILVPSYHSRFRGNLINNLVHGHIVISDDDGETWYLGATDFGAGDKYSNECQAVELKNGSVLLNARSLSVLVRQNRIQCISTDGGLSTGPTRYVSELQEPLEGCEGSLIRGPGAEVGEASSPSPPLFFTAPAARIFRTSLTMYRSLDEGATWQHFSELDAGAAGYSAMQALPTATGDHRVAIVYEQADSVHLVMEPDRIVFRTIPVHSDLPQAFSESARPELVIA
mmetsp:Transcript_19068/g.44558  ORF Transcript_19068/g.44558 Transcript_19068/m.44558 type:complete len:535 (-) Transcript_19068:59-1663(-)